MTPKKTRSSMDRRTLSAGAIAATTAGVSTLSGRSCSALAEDKPELHLAAVGQALIDHDLRELPYPGYDELARHLRQADIRFTNLETAIYTPAVRDPHKRGTMFSHAAEPAVLDCLQELGFNLLSLANNHRHDLGMDGMFDAMREVEKRGIVHAGTGENLEKATRHATIATPQAATLAIVAMASGAIREAHFAAEDRPGVNHLMLDKSRAQLDPNDARRNLQAIEQAAKQADYVLAYHHDHYWAEDPQDTPEWKKAWARACIDAGASLFVGHGVPQLQGIEIYKQRPIFYGLGNFIFHTRTEPGYYSNVAWESVVADCRFSHGRLQSLELRPVRLTEGKAGENFLKTRGRPRFVHGEQGDLILRRLANLSDQPERFKIAEHRATVEF